MAGRSEDDSEPAPDERLPMPEPEGVGLFGDAPVQTPPPAMAPAYRVLARKYRPTGFADLIGQEAMVRTLRNAFALGRVAHAFMLTGVRGVGKTTTARIIARALNCTGPDGAGGPTVEPCGVCENCRAILADRHPDVIEMDAASNTGVDNIREIIESVRFRPMQARTKVYVLDEVHMLSKPAFNALLKTLEEPPPHVKFIFATTELRKVPITVLSRCQRFDLRRVPAAALSAHFARIAAAEGVKVTQEALALIARAADGSVRDGLSLLDQAIAQSDGEDGAGIDAAIVGDMLGLADRSLVFDLFERAMAGRVADMLALCDDLHARGADLGGALHDLLDLVHTLTRLIAVPGLDRSDALPEVERARGAELAGRLSIPQLGRAWQMLLKGAAEVETAPDRRAAAEMVLIRLAHLADLPTPGELVRRLADAPPERAAAPADDGNGGGGGVRAVVGGGATVASPPRPAFASWRDVTAFVATRQEAVLHGHLLHSVHLVRFAPPVIELRPEGAAPRDLAPRLAALLLDATGTRWTIALSSANGAPTLAEQSAAADATRRDAAARHPLVRAILAAFPGATIGAVNDAGADGYGLAPEVALGGEAVGLGQTDPDMPDFAPLDAEFLDSLPDERDY